ncbi:hypothetical protein ACFFX0_03275 [Citricoccus parietis]|uniref:2,4-dichlorophenol 6-monooxygenase n=1 Tax=Citricoccus parietis TaxID=592307 RepID=A0ABV5FUA9_9MICC
MESYSEERVPVGRQVVRRANQSRIDFGPLRSAIYGSTVGDLNEVLARLQDTSAKGAVVRDALAPALKLKNYEFNAHGVEHNQRYTSRAIVAETGDPEGWPEDPELVAQPASRSGAKFPHAWLVGADGRRISTLDLAGGGAMTLVTGLSGTAWETAVGRLGLAFLRTAVIDSPGKADLYRTWQRLRDGDEAGALLIRPDGYVAWRQKCAVRDPEDAERQLRAALGQVLGRGSDWLTPIPNTLEDIDTPSARERIRSTSTITRR